MIGETFARIFQGDKYEIQSQSLLVDGHRSWLGF